MKMRVVEKHHHGENVVGSEMSFEKEPEVNLDIEFKNTDIIEDEKFDEDLDEIIQKNLNIQNLMYQNKN